MSHDRQPHMSQSDTPPDIAPEKAKRAADFYEAMEQLEDVLLEEGSLQDRERAEGLDKRQESDPETAPPPPASAPPAADTASSALQPDRQAKLALLEDAIADLESFLQDGT
ncbi:MAG: hypothetical protein ACO4CG_02920 [Prochlorothrix sp.]|nr:hypothetical protein [Prochlorothrix sp.]